MKGCFDLILVLGHHLLQNDPQPMTKGGHHHQRNFIIPLASPQHLFIYADRLGIYSL
jgi:hypothetical protein